MSTDPYWRIIGDQQKFYDFELMKAEAQQRMIASDTDTIECDITRTIGRIRRSDNENYQVRRDTPSFGMNSDAPLRT
jgi:hypothetical protein